MSFKTFIGSLFLLNFIFLFIACESEQQDGLAEAQQCLDTATPATAQVCASFLAGDESAEAYLVRCSADFLAEGFTAEKLVTAYSKKNNTETTKDPLLGMMGILAFSTKATVEVAYSDCSRSGAESFILFASMAKMATTIGSYGTVLTTIQAGEEPTQEEMETALDEIVANPEAQDSETIGEAVLQVNDSYCSQPGADANICGNIEEAIAEGAGDLDAIGQAILDALQE